MKDITHSPIRNHISYQKILLSAIAADGRHSFDGLSKLVQAQLGYAPKHGEAYVFLLKGKNDRVKVLTKTEAASNIVELNEERAQKVVLICRAITKLTGNK